VFSDGLTGFGEDAALKALAALPGDDEKRVPGVAYRVITLRTRTRIRDGRGRR
jgi:hypothetical protein